MDLNTLQSIVMWFVPVLLSLTVHEWAHAASAYKLGDDTAAMQGRLSLNPFVHVDPLGTFVLPLLQIFSTGSVYFAWAKPVPVSPLRFDRRITMSKGMVLVSAAGPLSNVLLAICAAVGLGIALRTGAAFGGLFEFLQAMFGLNLGLAIFNMLPVPPLDGSKVLHGMLPRAAARSYEKIFPYAPVLLLGVIFFAGRIITWPMQVMASWLLGITSAIAG